MRTRSALGRLDGDGSDQSKGGFKDVAKDLLGGKGREKPRLHVD